MKTTNFNKDFLLIMCCFLFACENKSTDVTVKSTDTVVVDNYQGELREYNGLDLSSLSEFVENSVFGPQYLNEKSYILKISGLVNTPMAMTYNQVLANDKYQKVVKLECEEGWKVTVLWEGVRIEDLLNKAGIKSNAESVIFRAADGYYISIPLKYIQDKKLLLAYKVNGLKLPPKLGFPFQVVAEWKKGISWIKWVTEIEVSSDTIYYRF